MDTHRDPRKVLRALNEELRAVLTGGRLYEGSELYCVILNSREAAAIREVIKAYTQPPKTTMLDRLKMMAGYEPSEDE